MEIFRSKWYSLTARFGPTENCHSIFKNSRFRSSPTLLSSSQNLGRNLNVSLDSTENFPFSLDNPTGFLTGWFSKMESTPPSPSPSSDDLAGFFGVNILPLIKISVYSYGDQRSRSPSRLFSLGNKPQSVLNSLLWL